MSSSTERIACVGSAEFANAWCALGSAESGSLRATPLKLATANAHVWRSAFSSPARLARAARPAAVSEPQRTSGSTPRSLAPLVRHTATAMLQARHCAQLPNGLFGLNRVAPVRAGQPALHSGNGPRLAGLWHGFGAVGCLHYFASSSPRRQGPRRPGSFALPELTPTGPWRGTPQSVAPLRLDIEAVEKATEKSEWKWAKTNL